MRHRAGWLLGFASVMLAGCLNAPVLWSPDGRWVAYTMAVRSDPRLLEPGWLFRVSPGREDVLLGWSDPTQHDGASAYRIWATRADTGASVLLEESPGPLTSPTWSPDGRSLAFGRLVAEANRHWRFEVVVQDAPDRKRVILKTAAAEENPRAGDLPGLTLAWSSDGRYLAVPWFGPTLGLAIIRADNGRILKEVADARLPSWSPDGSKLAFIRGTDLQSLHVVDTSFGPTRQLAQVGQVSQAPFWTRDKRWVMVVARHSVPQLGVSTRGPTLIRVPVDGAREETLPLHLDKGGREENLPLRADRSEPDRTDLPSSFSFSPEGDHVFYSEDLNGGLSQLVMLFPRARDAETRRRDNPVDFTVRLSALAMAPNGKTLAFRPGSPNYFSAPGFWDLESNAFTPLVPDDSARVEWIGTVVAAAREVLRTFLPAVASENGRMIERPTYLPIPGELAENHESIHRLRRLGRVGRQLCERPASAPTADPATTELIDEARLFFTYLCGDYDAALNALETLEARTDSPEHRLRLLSVRAQIYLGKGQSERAERTVEFLRSLDRSGPLRVEITPAGPSLTEEASPGQGWSGYLAKRAREWIDGPNGRPTDPLGGIEIDADPRDFPPNGAFPFAPGNFQDPRKDDVPLQNGGNFPPAGFQPLPGGVAPVPPQFRRIPPGGRRVFRRRLPFNQNP